jgi:hypothetical protein
MRLAVSVFVAVTAVTLVGCGGSDDETSTPVTLAQRFVSAEDAPGSKPDPVEKRETTTDFDTFISALTEGLIDSDRDELTTIFEAESFKSAGRDARFYGETHSPETSNHVFSSFTELSSDEEATTALDWFESDQMKPCPGSCAVQRSSFAVEDIPGARGVHRVATEEDIERVGTPDERPLDAYWIGFTNDAATGPSLLRLARQA